jgi:hypothetical protein
LIWLCFLFAQWHHEKEIQARSGGAIGNIADAPAVEARELNNLADQLEAAGVGSSLKPAEQDQDQHDNEYEAEPAATVVPGPVEGASAEATKATE